LHFIAVLLTSAALAFLKALKFATLAAAHPQDRSRKLCLFPALVGHCFDLICVPLQVRSAIFQIWPGQHLRLRTFDNLHQLRAAICQSFELKIVERRLTIFRAKLEPNGAAHLPETRQRDTHSGFTATAHGRCFRLSKFSSYATRMPADGSRPSPQKFEM
jgi:hypothetical protein